MHADIFLGIGSNVGDRLANLRWAAGEFAKWEKFELVSLSSVYESEAHTLEEGDSQRPYLNAVIQLESTLTAEELLTWCLSLELERGRIRTPGTYWEPRTLDLDVLAYGSMSLSSQTLEIPHPRLGERRFVLLPWEEIAPEFIVPHPFNRSVKDLLLACKDRTALFKTGNPLLD